MARSVGNAINKCVTRTNETSRVLFSSYGQSYGLPDQVVSDNGPQFTSEEFSQFLKRKGIKHICSAPYHPSTN